MDLLSVVSSSVWDTQEVEAGTPSAVEEGGQFLHSEDQSTHWEALTEKARGKGLCYSATGSPALTQGIPGCPGALPACEMKGLIWFLICMRRPSPRSTMVGKLSSLSVWPVGAVSNTTTEKFMPFTSLQGEEGQARSAPSSTPSPRQYPVSLAMPDLITSA